MKIGIRFLLIVLICINVINLIVNLRSPKRHVYIKHEVVLKDTTVISYYDTAIAMVKDFESFKSSWYNCSAGHKTIGYGTTLNVYPELKNVTCMNERTATKYLKKEFNKCLSVAREDNLIGVKALAIASFIYNVGIPKYKNSTLRKLLLKGKSIKTAMRSWVYGGNKKLGGLIKRRERELKLYYL